jgi:hypothetical protein
LPAIKEPPQVNGIIKKIIEKYRLKKTIFWKFHTIKKNEVNSPINEFKIKEG